MIRKYFPLIAVGAALTFAAPATAAPDRTATLGAGAPSFSWSGASSTGFVTTGDVGDQVPCDGPGKPCDDTLLKVESPGVLTLKTEGDGTGGDMDVDLFLYESDASGTVGKKLKESAGETTSEAIAIKVAPGYYLVQVEYYLQLGAGFKGSAVLETAAEPVLPANALAAARAMNHPPASAVARPPKRNVRVFVGSAADDRRVKKVQVGLLRLGPDGSCWQLRTRSMFARARKCSQPTVFLTAKGRRTWTFRLTRPLAPGRYVLFSRAIDTQGAIEAGFGRTNRRAFVVKR